MHNGQMADVSVKRILHAVVLPYPHGAIFLHLVIGHFTACKRGRGRSCGTATDKATIDEQRSDTGAWRSSQMGGGARVKEEEGRVKYLGGARVKYLGDASQIGGGARVK